MKRVCIGCEIEKDINCFYLKAKWYRRQCKDCYNTIRRELYKDSICKKCGIKFNPSKKGMGRFCSEICRFMSKIKLDKQTKCWLWRAHKNRTSYGTYLLSKWKKTGLAHRASYILFKGEIPKGMFVCHHCDTPPCVNPDHLWLGTASDNQIDCVRKGRK